MARLTRVRRPEPQNFEQGIPNGKAMFRGSRIDKLLASSGDSGDDVFLLHAMSFVNGLHHERAGRIETLATSRGDLPVWHRSCFAFCRVIAVSASCSRCDVNLARSVAPPSRE